MNNLKALRPRYGDSIGTAAGGRVVHSDQYDKFIDALIRAVSLVDSEVAAGSTLNLSNVLSFLDSQFPQQSFVTKSADYTSQGNEIIQMISGGTVTLGEPGQVTVWRDSSSDVSVTDGTGTDVFTLDQTVISYRYINETSEWVRGL